MSSWSTVVLSKCARMSTTVSESEIVKTVLFFFSYSGRSVQMFRVTGCSSVSMCSHQVIHNDVQRFKPEEKFQWCEMARLSTIYGEWWKPPVAGFRRWGDLPVSTANQLVANSVGQVNYKLSAGMNHLHSTITNVLCFCPLINTRKYSYIKLAGFQASALHFYLNFYSFHPESLLEKGLMCVNDCKCESVFAICPSLLQQRSVTFTLGVFERRVVTQRWVHRAADGQDVLVNQFDGTWSVGDLVVEIIGQSCSLQLQLLGLQRRLCWCLCKRTEQGNVTYSFITRLILPYNPDI